MKSANEFWADIEGFDGLYQVSNWGNVRRAAQKRYKKPTVDSHGYLVVVLWKANKQSKRYIHRLVAEAFVDGDTALTVDHVDGNKLNNDPTNLEWVSRSENTKRQMFMGLGSAATRFTTDYQPR